VYEKTNGEGTPAPYCMINVCDCGWREYTKIWFLSLASVLTGSLQ